MDKSIVSPFFVDSQCSDYKIISQGSVTTHLRCGGISSNHFITNFPQNVPVQTQNSFQNRSIFDGYMDNCLRFTFMATLYTSFPVPTCQFCFQKRSYCLIIAHKQFNDPCLYTLAIPEVSCAITLPHLRRVVSSCSRLPIVTIRLSVMISKQY